MVEMVAFKVSSSSRTFPPLHWQLQVGGGTMLEGEGEPAWGLVGEVVGGSADCKAPGAGHPQTDSLVSSGS